MCLMFARAPATSMSQYLVASVSELRLRQEGSPDELIWNLRGRGCIQVAPVITLLVEVAGRGLSLCEKCRLESGGLKTVKATLGEVIKRFVSMLHLRCLLLVQSNNQDESTFGFVGAETPRFRGTCVNLACNLNVDYDSWYSATVAGPRWTASTKCAWCQTFYAFDYLWVAMSLLASSF